jgi:2-polyprenyl-3-methyl-5-hydroxy-6-metoxy-1,4-benzoquinol methylase
MFFNLEWDNKMKNKFNHNFTKIKEDETTQKYFDRISKGPSHKFIENIIKEIKPLKVKNILDVGCGTGYVTKEIAKINQNITACDTDADRVRLAKGFVGEDIRNNITFLTIKPGKLPFKDNSFDLVVCFEVLEHVPNYMGLIKELKRVSKKYVLITVPNEPYFRIANFLRLKYFKSLGNSPGHINHFTKRKIVEILKKQFKIKKVETNAFFWVMVLCEI